MKNRILPFLSILFCVACQNTNHSADTQLPLPTLEFFGDSINPELPAILASELPEKLANIDSLPCRITGTVAEVCQTKGCWMDLIINDEEILTVRFKDYGFFMPKDIAGKTVLVEGYALRSIEEVAWLKHKAQDAGKTQDEIDAITQDLIQFSFMASGVIVFSE
jgi:hypothetical protein